MIYGYARVSTKMQERDGNSLEAQEQQLLEAGAVTVWRNPLRVRRWIDRC